MRGPTRRAGRRTNAAPRAPRRSGRRAPRGARPVARGSRVRLPAVRDRLCAAASPIDHPPPATGHRPHRRKAGGDRHQIFANKLAETSDIFHSSARWSL
ncbi:hypothetical protein CO709_03570 [Burkholderia thailandensis]|nr:hypothetical protein CO709_03570 [Burkholderia thailandensis]